MTSQMYAHSIRLLEETGYLCISYTDTVKVLQEFQPGYYDLIILDVKMSQLNECEFLRRLENKIML
jgi:CheY-like chemotaxis protein